MDTRSTSSIGLAVTLGSFALTQTTLTPEALAERFHEAYERLAPDYGYRTRGESAVPWELVPESNRRLMVAVCREILGELA